MTLDREAVIQWYPGHMATAMRKLDESMRMIDVIIEVVDARVPRSGMNPALLGLIGKRPRLIMLSREDLAQPAQTARWLAHYEARRVRAVAVNAKDQGSVSKAAFHFQQLVAGDRKTTARAMVLGIPNSGKSTIINRLLKRDAAKSEDRAGVTRATQWFRVGPRLELMDTPGILVPKIETEAGQWMLALTGAIPRERYDPEDVAERFHRWLTAKHPKTRIPDLAGFAKTRGFMRQGGEADLHNAALSYIKDFNDAKFGRLTFEEPDITPAAPDCPPA